MINDGYLSVWLKRWLAASLVCLIGIAGIGVYLLAGSTDSRSAGLVINEVRLKTNAVMLELEKQGVLQKLGQSGNWSKMLESRLGEMGLTVALLDGTVVYSSEGEAMSSLDMRTSLHYDLYAAKMDSGEEYRIAFPVIEEGTNSQIANAIFTVPQGHLDKQEAQSSSQATLIILLCVLSLSLLALLIVLNRKLKRDAIAPIADLKDHSEAMLKGHYEQKIERLQSDEWGELYVMFDQMRLELQHLQLRKQEQEQAQKELITNISHDLKTPLTTVKAYIEAIQAGVCPDLPAVMAYMEVMQTQADTMARLIDDLLLHALKELGQISVVPVESYSRALFSAIIQPSAHYVRTAGIDVDAPQAEEIPDVLIRADAVRIEQVVVNLVANALKHTAPGDRIAIRVEQACIHGKEQLRITVADTGSGISPQDMPFIFERYYQGKAGQSQVSEGTGLGLSICKHIVEAHGGYIDFQSASGKGTAFSFTLPLV
ncbi:sensor histidine kinase [Paenibacillus radicis (ex Gao et al. 2016)]|uniref:histidine kinase n=1 Tax=Paenibacillus radicis (ex Gao et al. 2016) TaxID=1737354 RepID=A0A917M5Y4_9BACL|nr:HAMP domain-containing sensor histidine kinase [Paenibacillus radicis (ex Gao et al. 2016)]GGG79378.1 two-component sensor histidine kinase [Paenibacillus radicis (ex Gao et al. 2016)]